MFNVENVRCFLSQIGYQQISLFIMVLIVLSGITYIIRTAAASITKSFPDRRMRILNWVPIFNFTIYVIGFFGSAYIIFHPSENMYLGFIASVLIGIAFASKDILQSIIAGFVLLIDKPFQVGDRITFQGNYGEVISIGLRSVKILTLDENMITVPNNRFVDEAVISNSAGDVAMMVSVTTHVPNSADLARVRTILENTARNSRHVNKEKPILVVAHEMLNGNGVSTIMFKTKCIINDDRVEQEFQTEFIIESNKKFKVEHIKGQ